ncbi:PDZ domain-like protein [Lederbergia lenta]|uniref:PDZ domain-like protein n=2 Tax=Lederbergia lenta TaxID=1467 RepID=A0A2X4WTR7_LEDLE|nr:PDZ domain-like protein [Lederbergia lenta]
MRDFVDNMWLIEFAKGFGKMFLNPVFYFSFILALIAGTLRIKRERRDFNLKVNELSHELRYLFPVGIVTGIVFSIIAIGTGFALPPIVIASIATMTILLGIIGNARLLSPALTIGIPLLALYATTYFDFQIPYFDQSFLTSNNHFFIATALLLGIFILTEGFFMLKDGLMDISPKLRKSRRGQTVGAHQTKRLWFIPMFLFLPAGPLTAPFDWWPVFEWGSGMYSPILVPFIIGFQHQVQSILPKVAVNKLAKQVILLGVITIVCAGASFWLPQIMPIVAGAIAISGRLWISYRHRVRERSNPYYFTSRNNGIMILDVIPDSPADKLELKIGEIIKTCNNVPVRNKQELYEALLINRAYCKLEVLDVHNELRLLQRALYEGDHHALGILFVEKRSIPVSVEAG